MARSLIGRIFLCQEGTSTQVLHIIIRLQYRYGMLDDGMCATEASRRLVGRARLSVEMTKAAVAQAVMLIAESKSALERAEQAIALATILTKGWPVHRQTFEDSQTGNAAIS
jgi:hypothetical protein